MSSADNNRSHDDKAAGDAGATNSSEKKITTSKSSSISSSNWAFGVAVVIIGAILLARNLGIKLFLLDFHHWWAVFILVAAIGPLQQAYAEYQKMGWTRVAANSLVSAGSIIFVALIFLLDLSFSVWWPVFVIIGGLYMLTSRSNI